jgi:hypothetical protein
MKNRGLSKTKAGYKEEKYGRKKQKAGFRRKCCGNQEMAGRQKPHDGCRKGNSVANPQAVRGHEDLRCTDAA